MNIYKSLVLSLIAGLSTLIGIIPTYINIKYRNTIIYLSLVISFIVLIFVSIFSLIPDAFKFIGVINNISILILIIFINIGFIISLLFDKYIDRYNYDNLYRVGLLSLFILILHNIPEGIITFISSSINYNIGLKLSLLIILHNIPEGILISIPIYYSTNNRFKAFIYTFISGFSELIGAFISYLFLYKYISNLLLFIILSITSGIMIYISLFDILKEIIYFNRLPS